MTNPMKVSTLKISDERLAVLDSYFAEVVAENSEQIWLDVWDAIQELRERREQDKIVDSKHVHNVPKTPL